jgi:hypothetical protein
VADSDITHVQKQLAEIAKQFTVEEKKVLMNLIDALFTKSPPRKNS